MLYYILDFLKDNSYFSSVPSFYEKTMIHFNGPDCINNSETCGIFDKLGYFSLRSPKTIFICHETLKEYCNEEKLSYAIVYDIICIHEYAHLIHYHHNPNKFKNFDLGFACDKHSEDSAAPCCDSSCQNCHKYYVETWAQWVTYKICEKLDEEHESNQLPPYIKTFNFLSKNISSEYLEYKKLLNPYILEDSDIIKLFLSENGWITDSELSIKLHYESYINSIKPKHKKNNFVNDWSYKKVLIDQISEILKIGSADSIRVYKLLLNAFYLAGHGVLEKSKKIGLKFDEPIYDKIMSDGTIEPIIKTKMTVQEWDECQNNMKIKREDLLETLRDFEVLGINVDPLEDLMKNTLPSF